MVELREKLEILLLQGRLKQEDLLLMEEERSRGLWKENAVVTEWVVQLLNRNRDIIS